MKKATQLKAALILFLGLTLISCSSMNRSIKESAIQINFNRNDFELTEQISANATQVKVFGIDWKRLFHKETGSLGKASVFGTSTRLSVPDAYAISELLKNNPGYDVVFYPYFERKHKSFLIFFSKNEVLVKARLAKIK
jgi:hypothetical protein